MFILIDTFLGLAIHLHIFEPFAWYTALQHLYPVVQSPKPLEASFVAMVALYRPISEVKNTNNVSPLFHVEDHQHINQECFPNQK